MFEEIDIWFYCLVSAAVVLRLLYSAESRVNFRTAFMCSLSAFICAKVGTEPVLQILPASENSVYKDAVIISLALLGNEIIVGMLDFGKKPRDALRFILSIMKKDIPK